MEVEQRRHVRRLAREIRHAARNEPYSRMHHRHTANTSDAMKTEQRLTNGFRKEHGFLRICWPQRYGQDYGHGTLEVAVFAMKSEILEEKAQTVLRCAAGHDRPGLAPAHQHAVGGQVRERPAD